MPKSWLVYILKCQDNSYYTGITNDLTHRIKQHNSGKGAKYTRGRRPVKLVFHEKCEDHSAALKREGAIKKLSRQQKIELIS